MLALFAARDMAEFPREAVMQRIPLSAVVFAMVIVGLFIIHDWQTAFGVIAFFIVAIVALAVALLIFAASSFLALFL